MTYYRQGPGRPGGPGGPGVRLGVPGLTPMIKRLMIVCVGVWLVQWILAISIGNYDLQTYLGVSAAGVLHGMLWQPLTYMFLHSPTSLTHIMFNMLMLWMFGGEMERYWGSKAFLRFYLVCGVSGGVLAVLASLVGVGDPAVPTIGASGAIMGLIMAFGIVFGDRQVWIWMLFPVKARTMAIAMVALNLFSLLTYRNSGVSYIAHLGGAIAGMIYIKRAWRLGHYYRELRWWWTRRRFRVMSGRDKDDPDRWVN